MANVQIGYTAMHEQFHPVEQLRALRERRPWAEAFGREVLPGLKG
jgi:hypothetical protein